MSQCRHHSLSYESPATKSKKSFQRLSPTERIEAARITRPGKRGTKKASTTLPEVDTSPDASTYPGPLILPGDDLYHDPDYPPQTVQEWINEEDRNPVTRNRKTIYVAAPPLVPDDLKFINAWAEPQTGDPTETPNDRCQHSPMTNDILEYLRAFYHPLPVKLLERSGLQWTHWDEGTSKRRKPEATTYVGLGIGDEAIRITTRKSLDGFFTRQVNLNDMIDAAMAILPGDAYSLLMVVEQDIYEDEDDDFCCGRAYGNSRVAVVSMARYNPALDKAQEVEREHAWPKSHCKAYGEGLRLQGTKKRSKKTMLDFEDEQTALRLAVSASRVPRQDLESLWLGRVCKTASHELGHCFAMDHCVFYACVMQGTAGLSEDARQPPYLCPVDMVKLLSATGSQEVERDKVLLRFCEKYERQDSMFAGFAAWLRFRLDRS